MVGRDSLKAGDAPGATNAPPVAMTSMERELAACDEVPAYRHTHSTISMADMEKWTSKRRMVAIVVKSLPFELAVAAVMLANLVVVVKETNDRSECRDKLPVNNDAFTCDESAPLRITHFALLFTYMLEIAARWYVDQRRFFDNPWNISDVVIVCLSVLAELLNGAFPSLGFLRIFRTLRLFRSIRAVVVQRELYIIVHGFAGTMKALFWAAILMMGLLTMWSILAVEAIHPINRRLDQETDAYIDCSRCKKAFSNVWESNLTFFYTVVLGDDWTDVIVPLISFEPWTVCIFMGVTFSVGMGLVNLILAVIVDRAREAHEEDVEAQNDQKNKKMDTAKKAINRMCARMDVDKSGTLSLDELLSGFDESQEFRQVLNVLDVEKDDMECVFHIMDADGSGDVSYDEFVDNLYRMKAQNSRTLLVFIKFYVLELRRCVEEELHLTKHEILTQLQHQSRILSALELPGMPSAASASPAAGKDEPFVRKTAPAQTKVRQFGSILKDMPAGSKTTRSISKDTPYGGSGGSKKPAVEADLRERLTQDDATGALYMHKVQESERVVNQMLESSDDMLRNLATGDRIAAANAVEMVGADGRGLAISEMALNPSSPSAAGNSLQTIPGMLQSPAARKGEPKPAPPESPTMQQPPSSPPELDVEQPGDPVLSGSPVKANARVSWLSNAELDIETPATELAPETGQAERSDSKGAEGARTPGDGATKPPVASAW